MNNFHNISGYTVHHRYLQLLESLHILTQRQNTLYYKLIHEADWRIANNSYGCFSGTREEVRERVMPNISQNTFNEDFKKFLKIKLIRSDKPRKWQVSNLHIHLATMHWPKGIRKHKSALSNFQEYLKKNLQDYEKEITDSVISEVTEKLLLFLTEEKFFILFSSANERNQENEKPMNKKVGESVGDLTQK
ncbi:hypothetical protein IPN35_05900 [Candidatus Peregrinibacteria bacterium]|nr:MAG: hypothetical protein IPN35_05900 [Candidatus Peregrinibacteria bacterium]